MLGHNVAGAFRNNKTTSATNDTSNRAQTNQHQFQSGVYHQQQQYQANCQTQSSSRNQNRNQNQSAPMNQQQYQYQHQQQQPHQQQYQQLHQDQDQNQFYLHLNNNQKQNYNYANNLNLNQMETHERERKRRHWRILISIGLLLPALAGLIGIVAWAISVEVADSRQQSISPQAQASRRLKQHQHHHQVAYQILHRDASQAVPAANHARFVLDGANHHQQQQAEAAAVVESTKQSRHKSLPFINLAENGKITTSEHEKGFKSGQAMTVVPPTALSSTSTSTTTTSTSTSTTTTSTTTTTTTEAPATAAEVAEATTTSAPATTPRSSSFNMNNSRLRLGSRLLQHEDVKTSFEDNDNNNSDHNDNNDQDRDHHSEQQSAASLEMESKPEIDTIGQLEKRLKWTQASQKLMAPIAMGGGKALLFKQQQSSQWQSSNKNKNKKKSSNSNSANAVAAMATNSDTGDDVITFIETSSPVPPTSSNQANRRQLKNQNNNRNQHDNNSNKDNSNETTHDQLKRRNNNNNNQLGVAKSISTSGSRQSMASSLSVIDNDVGSESGDGGSGNSNSVSVSVTERRDSPAAGATMARLNKKAFGGSAAGSASEHRAASDEEEERLNFEAIASAISSTLSDSAQQQSVAPGSQSSILGDTGHLMDEPRSLLRAIEQQQQQSQPLNSRRRSPGESVGEVIDQIVSTSSSRRRNSASQANDGSNRQNGSLRHGTHIVVVAPVSGDEMKARSQVKDSSVMPETGSTSTSAPRLQTTNQSSKSAENVTPAKTSKEPAKRSGDIGRKKHLLGARLLGSTDGRLGGEQTDGIIKYSERVEVIQDDDSSSMINTTGLESSGANLNADFDTSIHVASAPSQPRFRSPRHEAERSLFERYPKKQQQNIQYAQNFEERNRKQLETPIGDQRSSSSPTGSGDIEKSTLASKPNSPQTKQYHLNQPKLYSAERLIREHLMRSKSKQQPPTGAPTQEQELRASREHQKQQEKQYREQRAQPQPQAQSESQAQPESQQSQDQPQFDSRTQLASQQSSTEDDQSSKITSSQPFKVNEQALSGQMQQVSSDSSIGSQIAESQDSVSIVQAASDQSNQQQSGNTDSSGKEEISNSNVPNQYEKQQQSQSSSVTNQGVKPTSHDQAGRQPTANVAPEATAMPILPDQEYNVPAHMVDSVIHNIQSAPPATYGYVNGQLALLHQQQQYPNQLPFQQYQFNQQPHTHQHQAANLNNINSQQQYQHQNQQLQYQVPQQQEQQYTLHSNQPKQLTYMRQAASMYRPSYQQPPNHQQMYTNINQQPDQLSSSGSLRHQVKLSPQTYQPYQLQQMINYQHQHQPHQQILTNRNGVEQQSSPTKSTNNKAFIHPMAQFALKHLISSISGSKPEVSQASLASVAPMSPITSSVAQSALTKTSGANQQTARSSDSGSPQINALTDKQQSVDPLKVQSSADLMPPVSFADQQIKFAPGPNDQEVSESNYQQMPVYHMQEQPAYHMSQQHYGPPPSANYGGGANYESADDKRTKGITFHFGGGPIGGGTQLITSPMGIFKHLMLPLLPNPRVNLNGKVVFGVVLEKSTAFGAPPKKKHKFWG